MTKRILALILALVMVFALVACAKEDTTTQDPATTTPGTTTDPGTSEPPKDETPDANESQVEGAVGTGGEGEAVTEEEHVYTEVTVGSMGGKFVGHFDVTGGFSMDLGTAAVNLVFDRLFCIDPTTREWMSTILSEWSIDENNVAHLTVKDGVIFGRSGDQLRAEDLLFSFQRSSLSPLRAGDWAKYVDLEGCVISEDGMSIDVPFKMEFGAWMYQLSAFGIMEKSWIEENGGVDTFDWFNPELANGTGPYLATSYEASLSTVYEKRQDWWGNEELMTTAYAYADKITCLQYTDETTMMVDFENGVLDLVLSLSSPSMERVINDPSIGTAQSVSSNAVALLAMNYDVENGNPLFENENLRKAICYGADWKALSELCYGILYAEPQSVLPQSSPFAIDGCVYEYNPELAAQCMAESGLTDVTLTWVVNAGSPAATFAEAFAAYMSTIGITIDVQIFDILTCIGLWETPGATDFQLVCNNNANPSGDPYVLMQYLGEANSFHASNRKGTEINDMINSGVYTFDDAVRAEAYASLQEYLYNDYSVIPTCEWNVGFAYRDTIKSTRITDVYEVNLRYLEF